MGLGVVSTLKRSEQNSFSTPNVRTKIEQNSKPKKRLILRWQ